MTSSPLSKKRKPESEGLLVQKLVGGGHRQATSRTTKIGTGFVGSEFTVLYTITT